MDELSIFKKNKDAFENTFQAMPQMSMVCKPPQVRPITDRMVKYQNAEKLANEIILSLGFRAYAIISGKFIFGDFIEALIVSKKLKVKNLTISTLSMSQENVDSLETLITCAPEDDIDNVPFVENLTLIVSDYFYSHERGNLIKYIYDRLNNGRFQFAVCGSHTKICLIETHCGLKIVMHGSANLRSSKNIEQFVIEENPHLYDFNYQFLSEISDNFATIKKPIRHAELWAIVEHK